MVKSAKAHKIEKTKRMTEASIIRRTIRENQKLANKIPTSQKVRSAFAQSLW